MDLANSSATSMECASRRFDRSGRPTSVTRCTGAMARCARGWEASRPFIFSAMRRRCQAPRSNVSGASVTRSPVEQGPAAWGRPTVQPARRLEPAVQTTIAASWTAVHSSPSSLRIKCLLAVVSVELHAMSPFILVAPPCCSRPANNPIFRIYVMAASLAILKLISHAFLTVYRMMKTKGA